MATFQEDLITKRAVCCFRDNCDNETDSTFGGIIKCGFQGVEKLFEFS